MRIAEPAQPGGKAGMRTRLDHRVAEAAIYSKAGDMMLVVERAGRPIADELLKPCNGRLAGREVTS
jgi:hypothetical protein